MQQVVVMLDEYGVEVFHKDSIEVIQFDFSIYKDRLPTREELENWRKLVNKVTVKAGKDYLQTWLEENTAWVEDSERENELIEKDVQDAINLLRRNGYEVK